MDLAAILKALGEPMRLTILRQLLERKHCVRSLSRKLGITESAVSQHMKVLREAGLVYAEKYGRHTHYLPRQEALDMLAEETEKMRTRSSLLNRERADCQCEFRRQEGKT